MDGFHSSWYTRAMSAGLLSAVSRLTDQELIAQVSVLAQREREATAALVAHLAVLDERRLYLGEGCSSLFAYCVRVLRLSESAAYRRVEAARIARVYPIVLDMLSEGSVSLTTIRVLAPELTPANHRRLLDAAKNKTTREVERIVAAERPRPAVPSTVRRLPARMAGFVTVEAPEPEAHPPATGDIRSDVVAPTAAPRPVPEVARDPAASAALLTLEPRPPLRPAVVPLSPHRFKIQFTASEETHDLLRRAQNLLRHQIPDGDVGEVMAKALEVLVRTLEKERLAATAQPRGSRATDPRSRHIPADVRRAVWLRDGGQCAFVAPNGRRCADRGFLQFHHREPYSVGGLATVENIELRCAAHNRYEAELFFGPRGSPPPESRPGGPPPRGSPPGRGRDSAQAGAPAADNSTARGGRSGQESSSPEVDHARRHERTLITGALASRPHSHHDRTPHDIEGTSGERV